MTWSLIWKKEATKKIIRTDKFSKVAEYKINTQKQYNFNMPIAN
jgi:hypothetical protein